jgi:hypothetical protein
VFTIEELSILFIELIFEFILFEFIFESVELIFEFVEFILAAVSVALLFAGGVVVCGVTVVGFVLFVLLVLSTCANSERQVKVHIKDRNSVFIK